MASARSARRSPSAAQTLPALDVARIDIGHTMSDLEVHNLPLVARNPYNFALVQPGVTGIENVEFGVPRLAANGAAMRINYQVDGNTNTEKDRAGLRLLPMSEVMIQEVKVVTTGFAPEFGQTMGMVYNAVTPSGTNTFKGEGSYLFRRNPFSAFPFFFGCTGVASTCGDAPAGSVLPATKVDTGTADVGGPIIKNRAFFYTGWEQTRRDLSSTALITITPTNAAALGLAPQPVRRAERADRQVPDRQGRRPGQSGEPRHDSLDALPQRCAVQQRRRPGLDSAGDQLPRRDGLGRRSAGQHDRLEHAQRVPRAVRAPAPELGPQQRFGHRPCSYRHRHRELRQSAGRNRSGQRRLRLQAGHHPGPRQRHHDSRCPQLQDGLRLSVHRRPAHGRAAIPLHVRIDCRLQRGEKRR